MSLALRFRGALADLRADDRAALIDRRTVSDQEVRETAAAIIAQVRAGGDAALRRLARELDGVALDELEVPAAVRRRALADLDPELRRALEHAARNIESAHRAFRPQPVRVETEPGVTVGRRPDPLPWVGLYAPGGRAAYPSSVLMGAVPARVAGVRDIVLCTPPGFNGPPSEVVLAAAELAGVDRVFAVGGAGAIAAMAYGTATIPAVDCLVGPGNAWVAAAKQLVSDHVVIDGPAGPSELLVVADDTAPVGTIVAEMIAQAEHDPDACVVTVTTSAAHAAAIARGLDAALPTLARAGIVSTALGRSGGVLLARSVAEAMTFAAAYAPEHLLLAMTDPEALLPEVRHAGTVFLGSRTSVVFGDYVTGANHVLPTGGAARRVSGLSTATFVRWTTYQETTPAAAGRLARDVAVMARAEGLEGHAAAACAAGAAGREAAPPHGDAGRRPPPPAREVFGRIAHYTLEPTADPRGASLDLSDNVDLWGAPPAASAALARLAAQGHGARYPAPYGAGLKRALADACGVTPDMIVVGCGSDDVLDGAIRAWGAPGGRLAHIAPSFGMIPALARANGLEPVAVPLTADLDADAAALLAPQAGITYVCSPNNPTGNALGRAALGQVVGGAEGLVLVDEAYVEFAAENARHLLALSDAVLLTRTLSKAFGLAGLRIGYGVGAPAVVREIEKALGPYKLSARTKEGTLAALTEGRPWVDDHVAQVRANRDRLQQALRAIPGLDPIASQANFVLIRLGERWGRARTVADGLARRGILVRAFSGLPVVPGGEALRTTVGPWELMDRLLDALRAEAPCA